MLAPMRFCSRRGWPIPPEVDGDAFHCRPELGSSEGGAMRRTPGLFAVAMAAMFEAFFAGSLSAAERVALVIGNAAYEHTTPAQTARTCIYGHLEEHSANARSVDGSVAKFAQNGELCAMAGARGWRMNDFKGRHFEGEVVLWAVRWYCRYPISYRDLEAMMTERGVDRPPAANRALEQWSGVTRATESSGSTISENECAGRLRRRVHGLTETVSERLCGCVVGLPPGGKAANDLLLISNRSTNMLVPPSSSHPSKRSQT